MSRRSLLICLYFFVLGVQYSIALPPFESADEAAHTLYIHNLLEDRALPRIASREQISQFTEPTRIWAIETHQPPLYYAIGAVLISWTQRHGIDEYLRPNELIFTRGIVEQNHHKWLHNPTPTGEDTSTAIWILRLYSLILGTMTLWTIYHTAKLLFDDCRPALMSMLLVASIPTYVSISAGVNNDNLVTLLYAVGAYLMARIHKLNKMTDRDALMLGLVLAAIALTKITGLSLFVIVYGGLLWFWHKRTIQIKRRQVLLLMLLPLLLAGWWYVRNIDLYGDPFALSATQSLWGREFEIAATSGNPWQELSRIWRSFWAMVGHLHQPVYGPPWFFAYVLLLIFGAVIGLTRWLVQPQKSHQRAIVSLLTAVCFLVVLVLLIGTRSVDISYGRLLFPALVGFGPLMILGWHQIVGRYLIVVVIAPLVIMTWIFPVKYIARGYPQPSVIEGLPDTARTIAADVEGLRILAYEFTQEVVKPGDNLHFWLYVQGQHVDNLALTASVIDLTPSQQFGQIEVYPGMAPTDSLDPDSIYRFWLYVPLNQMNDQPAAPGELTLQLRWFDPESERHILITDGNDVMLDHLLLAGPVLVDPDFDPPAPEHNMSVQYGDSIKLDGYTFSTDAIKPGDTLDLTLHWRVQAEMDADYTVAAQLIDAENQIVAQSDGMPAGYPTSAWVQDSAFADERSFVIPADVAPGEYRILIGWYRPDDFVRLPVSGDGNFDNNLLIIPLTISDS